MTRIARSVTRIFAIFAIASVLTGCNALNRLAEVGGEPPMTTIQNPTKSPNYRPVTMPMPRAQPIAHQPNSLWRAGSRAFFKDQRAAHVGDILTVLISIDDTAEITNTTKRTRANTEDASLNALFGYESSLNALLPEAVNAGNLIDLDSETSNEGAQNRRDHFPETSQR